MLLVVAAKKKQGEWRGAVIVDNEFQDTLHGMDLVGTVMGIVETTLDEYDDQTGQEVTITINMRPTDGQK